ncbi:hypothetical protein ACFW9M_14200 [Streptomyces lydicus]|uniref:hypothetical protein n=1 Tax=Streptomyces lydicus TaxID=47763 RepID=UPI003694BFD1
MNFTVDSSSPVKDVHRVVRPGVREQFAELRPLKRVEAAGGAGLLKTAGSSIPAS